MSTRSKKKAAPVATVSPPKKRVENSWVMFVQDSLLVNSSFKFITLPHPAHGMPAKYCVDDDNSKLYEIVTFNEPYRSWFIGETVKSEGTMQILTPVNSLFLVLPRLKEQCRDRAVPLEDLLSEKGYDQIIDIIHNLDSIGDMKGPADMKAYKYNEDKTLAWLEDRVKRLAKVLRCKNIHVTSGATSASFISSNINNENIDEKFYLKYAFGIISEYISNDIMDLLEKKFDFKPELIETIGKKRKSELNNTEPMKRIKSEVSNGDVSSNGLALADNSLDDIKKDKPLSAKEKARQKAASGSKTISSFFKKK